ncbi:MAG: phosphoribosylformylglycinamidine cyclo-ligase [Nitrospira sp.]|nr:phosphoribosylformylglycinamidine cyclo-ligase [Nitrospira sp.]
MSDKNTSLTYKQAGVDIEAGDRFVNLIKPLVRKTFRPGVLTDLGGFGGLFRLSTRRYKDPVLVSGTDGVGTKLKVAFQMDRHGTVGIDLVAMCVNDVVVSGAEPIFFLDYLAMGHLEPQKSVEIMKGVVEGCQQAGCALIGGETAEMPSIYAEGEYDLAGFAVGVVEKAKIVDGRRVKVGDALIGLASSGLHSNGYSLVRKVIFDMAGLSIHDRISDLDRPLGEELLTPTRIYVKSILSLLKDVELARAIKGIAHITGGGITENLPRVFPSGCGALITRSSWEVPPIFGFLQHKGGIAEAEMYRTFNMGLGIILVVSRNKVTKLLAKAKRLGERAFLIGEVIRGSRKVDYV